MLVYVDIVAAIVSQISATEELGTVLREYEAVTGVTINQQKSVELYLCTWIGRSIPTDCLVEDERKDRLNYTGSVLS